MAQQKSFLQIPRPEEGEASAPEEDEDEEGLYKVHLFPRSSPVPRRKADEEEEEDEDASSAPAFLTRKVSFADALGLDLVDVRYYEKFESPGSPDLNLEVYKTNSYNQSYYIFPSFILPASNDQLLEKINTQKVEVESILPVNDDPLSISGLIRVANISFQKMIYVRATLDNWATYFDHLADYVPGSSDGTTDQFCFRLSFVTPFLQDGARIEFVIRYETPEGVFWANNQGKNYTVVLKVEQKPATITPGRQTIPEKEQKKLTSCLKPTQTRYRHDEMYSEIEETEQWNKEWTNEASDLRSIRPAHLLPQMEKVEASKLLVVNLLPESREFQKDKRSAFTELPRQPDTSESLLQTSVTATEQYFHADQNNLAEEGARKEPDVGEVPKRLDITYYQTDEVEMISPNRVNIGDLYVQNLPVETPSSSQEDHDDQFLVEVVKTSVDGSKDNLMAISLREVSDGRRGGTEDTYSEETLDKEVEELNFPHLQQEDKKGPRDLRREEWSESVSVARRDYGFQTMEEQECVFAKVSDSDIEGLGVTFRCPPAERDTGDDLKEIEGMQFIDNSTGNETTVTLGISTKGFEEGALKKAFEGTEGIPGFLTENIPLKSDTKGTSIEVKRFGENLSEGHSDRQLPSSPLLEEYDLVVTQVDAFNVTRKALEEPLISPSISRGEEQQPVGEKTPDNMMTTVFSAKEVFRENNITGIKAEETAAGEGGREYVTVNDICGTSEEPMYVQYSLELREQESTLPTFSAEQAHLPESSSRAATAEDVFPESLEKLREAFASSLRVLGFVVFLLVGYDHYWVLLTFVLYLVSTCLL
ncbi:uncharacterized protein LOC102356862 [Latimeria chalumnae]|uniref:uncharacterized protein LOC102356862 n=1 Tax=Latimeria chalumnae TaxID=7897 RepID=UPI0003C14F19|nr:PREDICTED: uncharacterized protein LOC102356862 [Latimeria chalumnae]|eukprot:XP_006001497.1 PREDICTED: uncharacterized protein LOC102356862 [Latimeria chalumnae]